MKQSIYIYAQKPDALEFETLGRLTVENGEGEWVYSPIYEGPWVPDEVHEAVRDLVRARQAASFDVRKARQRIQSFLLKYDRHYAKKPWGAQHRTWLSNQSFDHPAQQIAYENYRHAESQAMARRDEIDAQIREILPTWSLFPLVSALQALRGIATIIAVCIVAEVGDMSIRLS